MFDQDPVKAVEAILFVAGEPVSLQQLAKAVETTPEAVEKAITELEAALANRGIRISQSGDRYLLVTAPQTNAAIENFLGAKVRQDISKPAMETLAIIAYKQPVTKSQIEAIRGVASDQTLKNLLLRGLVVEAGIANEPGRPTLYQTSMKFLQLLGLSRVQDMPSFESDTTSEA